MTTKISDFHNRPVQTGTDKKVTGPRDAAASPAQPAVAASSPVKITDQARQLASLEQAMNSLPVVNESRVAAVRSAIEDGRYQVNPERIADKLLRTERELSAQ